MAPFNYIGCEFRYLWRDLSPESLRDYALRLADVFQEQDHRDGFSSEQFVKTFKNQMERYDPYAKYRFDFHRDGNSETWQIRFLVTQIPHVEGGIVRRSPQNENRLRFGHSLLEHSVANTIEITEFVKAKGIRRLLPRFVYIRGTLVGESVYLYLWQRLQTIPGLHLKLRAEPRSGNSFNFYGFLDLITRVFESTHANVVELSYGLGTSDVGAFMQRSDELLLSNLESGELSKLFALIELSPNEWFGS
jgi:hypothetical protein